MDRLIKYAHNGIKIQHIHDCECTNQNLKTVVSKSKKVNNNKNSSSNRKRERDPMEDKEGNALIIYHHERV